MIRRLLISLVLAIALISSSCKKNLDRSFTGNPVVNPPPPPPPQPVQTACNGRPFINATLVPFGSLSSARAGIVTASAGNKIVFIGGMHSGQNWWNEPVPADIYDISSNTWSVHFLVPDIPQFTHFRYGAAIASVGNKVLFAGGGDVMADNVTAQVDIYNASSDTWSKTELSVARLGLAAATVGDKVVFAGGFGYPNGNNWGDFNTVDIYDNSNNSWSTATLSHARMDITATTADNKVYFAGGRNGLNATKTVDIYDATSNTWSVSALQQPRAHMASIAVDGKIFWGSGGYAWNGSVWMNHDNVEIQDITTGATSTSCMIPRLGFSAVKKNDRVVFFTGSNGGDGTQFEIYDTITGQWSTGKLDQKIQDAAIISVNNTIYVAGGRVNGAFSNQVWRLEF
jgi:hypothetical protein